MQPVDVLDLKEFIGLKKSNFISGRFYYRIENNGFVTKSIEYFNFRMKILHIFILIYVRFL